MWKQHMYSCGNVHIRQSVCLFVYSPLAPVYTHLVSLMFLCVHTYTPSRLISVFSLYNCAMDIYGLCIIVVIKKLV